MKKIGFVTPIYAPAKLSGSGMAIQQLAEGLDQKGYGCSIVTSNGLNTRWWYDPVFGKRIEKKFEIINGVKVYRLGCQQISSFLALILVRYFKFLLPKSLFNKLAIFYSGPNLVGLFRLLKRENFDIIYCSPFPIYLNKQVADIAVQLTPRPKLILMPCFHSLLPDYHNLEFKPVLKKADLIHVFSGSEKEDIKKIFQIPDKKFVVIPLFLNLSQMSSIDQIEDKVINFKKKFKLENKKIILFAGNKIYEKGLSTLFRAVKNLYQKDPSYVLVTIGNDVLAWKKFKKKMNPQFLIDLDYVNEKQKEIVFAACDIFCLPSLAESFGLTYLEAWHKKKPVIGADIPTVRELILGANAGLLVKFGDERNLAKTIEKLAQDQSLSKTLGENGYQALVTNYNLGKLMSKLEKLFNE